MSAIRRIRESSRKNYTSKLTKISDSKKLTRMSIILSVISILSQSRFVTFLWTTTAIATAAIILQVYSLLLISLIVFSFQYKRLIFEAMLVMHVIQQFFGWTWYTLVDEDLYLGALPLSAVHKDVMKDKLKIKAVLSLNEDFELNSITPVGKALDAKDFERLDIDHMQLRTPDFCSPPFDILNQAADFINMHLSEGKRVYCHCKSGKGRSASAVIAYFIKYKRMDALSAHAILKAKRPVIFGTGAYQMKNMIEYEKNLRGGSKSTEAESI